MSPGAVPWSGAAEGGGGCLVFQLVCRFHRSWAYSSTSTVQPKMESRFQDEACSVCFLFQYNPVLFISYRLPIFFIF